MSTTMTTASTVATVSMVAGGGMLAYGLLRLAAPMLRKPAGEGAATAVPVPVVAPAKDFDVIDLAQEVGWVEVADPTAYWRDVRNMYTVWRQEHPITSPDRPIKVNDTGMQIFYNEYVRSQPVFEKNPYFRVVVIMLLELLDRHSKEPSVVIKDRVENGRSVGDTEDDTYDESSYRMLAKVPLFTHSINVARIACDELIKKKLWFRIPSVMVAALAHDIGKISAIRQGRNSREHAVISCEVLQSMPGFNLLPSHKEILQAIRHHHTGKKGPYISELLPIADHEARQTEYEQVLTSMVRELKAVPQPGNSPWKADYQAPGWEDLVKQIPVKEPQAPPECVAPPLEAWIDEMLQDAADQEETETPPADDDNGQTLRDPLLAKVERWVQTSDLEVCTPDAIMEEFQVGRKRASALFEALLERGVLLPAEASAAEATEAAEPDASPVVESQQTAPQAGMEEPAAPVEEEEPAAPMQEVVLLSQLQGPPLVLETNDWETTVAPPPLYGTVSALTPADPQEDDHVAKGYEDIAAWFIAERFIELLRPLVNVDKASAKKIPYFQAVTMGAYLYVHVQGVKDIIAQLLAEHGDMETSLFMRTTPQGAAKREQSERQNGYILQVIRYFRHNGGIDGRLVSENHVGVPCYVEVRGEGKRREYWMVPFFLHETFPGPGDAEALAGRKNENPFVRKVLGVVPKHLDGVVETRKGAR